MIDVKKDVTSRLNIEPSKNPDGSWKFNGLCPVKLVNVKLTDYEYKKGEFEGLTCKGLTFEFENVRFSNDEPVRYHTHGEKLIGSQLTGGIAMKEEDVEKNTNDMWARIKHILDNCASSGKNFRNISDISEAQVKKYFSLPNAGTPIERRDAFEAFFKFLYVFINGITGEGKEDLPKIYINEAGKPVQMWAKLIPNYSKDEKSNGKWYVFPTWVGKGFLEPIKYKEVDKKLVVIPANIVKLYPNETLDLSVGQKGRVRNNNDMPGDDDGNEKINPDVLNMLASQNDIPVDDNPF